MEVFNNASNEEHVGKMSEEKFLEILRKKLHYLEGFADGLIDMPQHVLLKRWVDSTRLLLNRVGPKGDK